MSCWFKPRDPLRDARRHGEEGFGHRSGGEPAVTSMRPPRIAAVGQASWHHQLVTARWPPPGGFEVVHAEHSVLAGSTAVSSVALARLGAEVSFAGVIGDDAEGAALRAALESQGVGTGWLTLRQGERTDTATVIIAGNPPERFGLWHPGARIVRRDRLDIAALFDHDVVLLDVADAPLRRFLTDLPAHTLPRTRLVGPLHHLVSAGLSDALEVALRHDVLVGTDRDLMALAGVEPLDEAVEAIQSHMRGTNLRSLVVFLAAMGCRIYTPTERWSIEGFPVAMTDTAAIDRFVAGAAYGIARRWPWPETGRFATAVTSLSARLGDAQSALPSLEEVRTFLELYPVDGSS